jgi:PAS domain S-box-containing protein
MTAADLHPPEDHTLLRKWFETGWEAGGGLHLQTLQRKDGRLVPVEENQTLVDTGGERFVLSIVRDITERMRVEAETTRLAAIVNSSDDAIFSTEREGLITTWNAGAERMYGYAAEEIRGKHFTTLIPEDQRGALAANRERIDRGEALVHYEQENIRKDGSRLQMSLTLSPLKAATGFVTGVSVIARNITERKRAEEALIEERHLLHTLMDNLPASIYFKDRESRFTRINLAHANLFELSHPAEAVGKTDFDFFTAEHAQQAHRDEQEIIRTGQPVVGKEEKETWPDGHVTWARTTKMPLRDAKGNIFGTFGVSYDITERRLVEEALRDSEERFRGFVQNATVGIYRTTPQGRILLANPSLVRMLGYEDFEALAARNLEAEGFEPHYRRRIFCERLDQDGEVIGLEDAWTRRDGSVIFVRESARAFRSQDGKILYYDGIVEDITERKRAEEALRDSEEKYRVIYESSRDAIMMLAPPEWEFTAGNPAAIALFEARDERELLAATPWTLSPEYQSDGELSSVKARQMIDAAMERGSHSFEWTHKKLSGEEFFATVSLSRMIYGGQPLLQATVRDITDRKRAEAEMAEGHRLATLVAEVGGALTRAESLRQGLQRCAEILVRDIGVAFARVWTVNEEENVLELQASAGIYTHIDGAHARVPFGKFNIGRIAESGEPHLTNSVQEDSWVGDAEWARREGMVTFAGYPLRVEGRVLGVVAAFARQPLTEATFQACASVANSLAQFIKRKRGEQQTRLQTAALESAANGVVIASRDGRIMWVNPAFTRLTGYSTSEVIGENPRFLKSGVHDKVFYQKFWNTILSGEVWRGELVNRRKEGTLYTEEMTITPVRDVQGSISHFIAIKQDITARKRAEQDLLFKSALLEAESETAIDGILLVDTAGHVLLANRQFARMWNIPEEALRTKDDKKLMEHALGQLKDAGAFLQKVNHLYAHESEKSRDEIELKDGRVFDRYSSPLRDSMGQLYGRIWYFRDITERSELARMKSELVSVVSHELRTPLTSIRGALGLLSGGLLRSQPEKGERMLKIAVSNTDRLVRLINDILDLERLESGKMNMAKRTCNAADLMTQAADSVRDLADKAGVTLSVSPHAARLWVDPDHIIQTFINLLSNAVKFSPRGKTVWLSATPQADRILFQVKDLGRGIPQEKCESIFERFQQVDASDRREKGGTGLGLPIARSIVQQHGGRIWVESTLGQGSTFFFTLPSLPSETNLVGDGSGARKVLVCAVEANTRSAVQAILNQRDYTVVASSSWQEVIEMAALDRPDTILLDSSLPGMGSLETITALKQKPHIQDVPVIGIGGTVPDEVQLAAMGMAGWVAGPLNQVSLLHALESVLGTPSEGPRVLVVEDDADLARVLTTIFERHGAVVFHVRTGQEAIQVCPQIVPDLLVLDVILPELDGFGVVEQLRQHECLQHLPLAVYSVKEFDDSEKARLQLGESIFMTKSRLTPQEFEQRAIGLLNWATSGQRERRRR